MLYIFISGVGAEPGMNLYEVPITVLLTCTKSRRLMLKKAEVESITTEFRREVLTELENCGW